MRTLSTPIRFRAAALPDWLGGEQGAARVRSFSSGTKNVVWPKLISLATSRRLAGIGAVNGNKVEALGVSSFGQSADIPSLSEHYQINTDAIVNAARRR